MLAALEARPCVERAFWRVGKAEDTKNKEFIHEQGSHHLLSATPYAQPT